MAKLNTVDVVFAVASHCVYVEDVDILLLLKI